MENLLDKEANAAKKLQKNAVETVAGNGTGTGATVRGTSDSTSGCDSGQSYESEELYNMSCSKPSSNSSAENIALEDSGRVSTSTRTTPSPYVMQVGPPAIMMMPPECNFFKFN
jgi:hypothetical protein